MKQTNAERQTIRGIMKSGKVELLDDTTIEDGSLLDITVVKTGTQVRAEAKEKKRNNSKQNAVVFSCMGKPKSADPLVVFQILPKSPRATLAFKDYEFQTHIVLDDVMSALVKHAIQISKPPAKCENADDADLAETVADGDWTWNEGCGNGSKRPVPRDRRPRHCR